MTKDEINKRVAELEGWKLVEYPSGSAWERGPNISSRRWTPDYCYCSELFGPLLRRETNMTVTMWETGCVVVLYDRFDNGSFFRCQGTDFIETYLGAWIARKEARRGG